MKLTPTSSTTHKIGFKKDFEKGLCDYWYSEETYNKRKSIEEQRYNPWSRFHRLLEDVPVKVNKETKEVTIDYGILNLMLS
jgi:hypothetical protein